MELTERKKSTLKEKLTAHYHNRDFTPKKNQASKAGLGFYWFMVLTIWAESMFITIPRLDGGYGRLFLSFMICFIAAESMLNWMLVWADRRNEVLGTTKEKYFPSCVETPQGWRTCPTCQIDAPPRSHHCTHCNRCILKRDTHCFFTASCVGFYNQRYFVIFCFYAIAGSLLALFLQVSYISQVFPIFSWDVIVYIPPVTVMKWIMGVVSTGMLAVILHTYLTVACLGMSIFVFAWQLVVISEGLTSHEAWKRILVYKSSFGENFGSVFGHFKYLFVMFLFPLHVQQNGNGVQWVKRYKREKGL